MILAYPEKNYTFEPVEGSSKSKASCSEVLIVVVVAAARLHLRFPRFQSNFKPILR